MILIDEEVVHCLRKAKEIIEQYELYAQHPRDLRSIDDLEWVCGEYLGRRAQIHELRIEAGERSVRGFFVAYADGRYEIYRLADLTERERRFVTCKELFHVILDEEPCRNMDLLSHLEEAYSSFTFDESHPNIAVKAEMLAEIAAMEFLFPYARRVEEIERNGRDDNFFSMVAAKYGIPQIYVEQYLSDHYMEEFGSLSW